MKASLLAALAALAVGLSACATSSDGNGGFLSNLGQGASDAAKQATQNAVNQKVTDTTNSVINH